MYIPFIGWCKTVRTAFHFYQSPLVEGPIRLRSGVPHHNWPLSLSLVFLFKVKVKWKGNWKRCHAKNLMVHGVSIIWDNTQKYMAWQERGGILLFLAHWKCEQCSDINNIYLFGVWSWSLWYESVHSRKQHNIKSHTSGYTPHSLASAHIAHMCALCTHRQKRAATCNMHSTQYTVWLLHLTSQTF